MARAQHGALTFEDWVAEIESSRGLFEVDEDARAAWEALS